MAPPLSDIAAIIRGVMRNVDMDLLPTTRFDDLPDWDPMDLVSVVVEAECRYNLQFDLQEIDRLVTIGDLLMMIQTKQALAMV